MFRSIYVFLKFYELDGLTNKLSLALKPKMLEFVLTPENNFGSLKRDVLENKFYPLKREFPGSKELEELLKRALLLFWKIDFSSFTSLLESEKLLIFYF